MKRRGMPIKYRLIATVLLILVPITLVFSMFTSRTILHINQQLAEANKNTLKSYCTAIEDEIRGAESFMNFLWGEQDAFAAIVAEAGQAETDQAEADNAQLEQILPELEAVFTEQMDSNPSISCLAVYTRTNGLLCQTFTSKREYSEPEMREIEKMISNLFQGEAGLRMGWFVEYANQSPFFVRIAQKGNVSAVCLADIQEIARRSQSDFALASPVVIAQNERPLTSAMWLKKTWGETVPDIKDFSFAGEEQHYMVVSNSLMGLKALYGVPYRNNMGALGWLRLGPLLFSGVSVLVLVAAWIYLKHSFFRPLSELVSTMERIRANDLESRPGRYTSQEFAQVNETFNSMIDTITNLKIENYEQRLSAQNAEILKQQAENAVQQAEMTTLRLQIHPHFYLNCLKSIYGLAQFGSFLDIQEMILMLSKHLRYTFTINTDVVPLSNELQMCENYIRLQAVGQDEKPQCHLDVAPELLDLEVPPISILTLVENCVKHGAVQNHALCITIKAACKVMEDGVLANIMIQDNGPGFSKEILEELNRNANRNVGRELDDSHVGLSNVIRRFRLLYGEDFAISFWNQQGACIELMIFLRT